MPSGVAPTCTQARRRTCEDPQPSRWWCTVAVRDLLYQSQLPLSATEGGNDTNMYRPDSAGDAGHQPSSVLLAAQSTAPSCSRRTRCPGCAPLGLSPASSLLPCTGGVHAGQQALIARDKHALGLGPTSWSLPRCGNTATALLIMLKLAAVPGGRAPSQTLERSAPCHSDWQEAPLLQILQLPGKRSPGKRFQPSDRSCAQTRASSRGLGLPSQSQLQLCWSSGKPSIREGRSLLKSGQAELVVGRVGPVASGEMAGTLSDEQMKEELAGIRNKLRNAGAPPCGCTASQKAKFRRCPHPRAS